MITAAISLLVLLAAQPDPKAQPATPPASAQPTPAKQPTLDELLGLPNAKPAPTNPDTAKPGEVIDPAKAELQRQLSPGEVKQAFEQAVAEMDQTADRLHSGKDAGLDTQRMQEDVLRKLDTLIDQAKKKQSKSKSKKNQQQQQQQDQQNQPQQSSQQNKSNDGQNKGPGPAMADGTVNAVPGGTAAWGNLPEHVRDALVQGKSDQYSSVYKLLTEKYYKRLAEEPKPVDRTPEPIPTTTPETPKP